MVVVGATVLATASVAGPAVGASSKIEPHGTNFGIHTYVDPNFCMESEGDGRIMMSQCAVRDNQHFTFTNNGDGTSLIVDGYGLCLDRGNGVAGTAVMSLPCNFGASQKFKYTVKGKLDDPGKTSCVATIAAALDAAVFDAKCTTKHDITIFQLSH
jgi:Ricin-type beta-trefoil lectin domain